MATREDGDRNAPPRPQERLETPFVEEGLFDDEAEAGGEPLRRRLPIMTPFLLAFEAEGATPIVPQHREEEIEEEGWFPAGDGLAPGSAAELADLEHGHGERPEEQAWGEADQEVLTAPSSAFAASYYDEEVAAVGEVEPDAAPDRESEGQAAPEGPFSAYEEAFLNELDEEDEAVLLEGEAPLPPPLRVVARALPVPASDPLPFAPAPPTGSYWPIVTRIRQGREVNYRAVGDRHVGSTPGRSFLAARSNGTRHHVGVDLFANLGDPVVACQDGRIVAFYPFCCGAKKTTNALLVEHAGVVVNYGEVAPDSLERTGRRLGSEVRAGEVIGYIGRNPGGSSMLHFETYAPGTTRSSSWPVGEPRPRALRNPTEYLLFLSESGLAGRMASAAPIAPPPGPAAPAAKPPAELVRFAQRVLNAVMGERLAVDGDLGPLTRGALQRFRERHGLGAGGVLDARTEIALAQRALEEIAQQSMFAQPGVLDARTEEALSDFKSGRGLRAHPTLDAATRTALADAVAGPAPAVGAPSPAAGASSGSAAAETLRRLGTLLFQRDGKPVFRYTFTPDDLLWTARLISGEAGAKDDRENRAVIAAMLNRFALFTHRVYPTFAGFLRAYSTPLQPVLLNKSVARHYMNDPRFRRIEGSYYEGTTIPRGQLQHHLDLQKTPWERLRPLARKIAIEALTGRMPDTGIGLASEFASTWILYGRHVGPKNRTEAGWLDFTQRFKRDKGWRWIGPRPDLDQKRNAFFLDPRAASLPADAVQVLAP